MAFLPYPAKGLLRGHRGLNLVDYLLNIGPDFTLKSQNVYFFRNTLRRRHGFTRHSTEDWTAAAWVGGHEFLDGYGNARLLVARGNGEIHEVHGAASSTPAASGLAAGRETEFATAFGACFVVNGDDSLRRLDATSNPAVPCTSRVAGKPAKPSLAVTAGAAGALTGDFALVATSVIEDGSGNRLLESDWSDIQQITVTAGSISGTVTAPAIADARITHFYIYRTDNQGAQPKYLRKVTVGAPAWTNDATADVALTTYAPARGKNLPPPTAPQGVALSGSRLILWKDRTLYFSPRSLNAYDIEGFPNQVDAPGAGPIKTGMALPNPGSTLGTNSFMVWQESSTHIVYQSDPTQPIATLSPEVGLINKRAVAVRGKGVFWVDRKRGVMWWPGGGSDIYTVGDRVLSALTGKGYQGVPANIGDGNVALTVWDDKLLLTVRDDSSAEGPNKVYQMDLLAFERNLPRLGPAEAAVWAGPWSGPCFYRFIPRVSGGLLLLDNADRTILEWDPTTYKDSIGGEDIAALPAVKLGPTLAETTETNKRIHQVYLIAFANQASKLRLIGEEHRFDLPDIALTPINYGDIPFEDIEPVDIEVAGNAWKSEGAIDWSALAVWFLMEFYTDDGDNDWIFVGAKKLYTRTKITRTYV